MFVTLVFKNQWTYWTQWRRGISDYNVCVTMRKEKIFYAAVAVAVIGNEIATYYGVQALTLLPLLLFVVFVGFWAFDVK
jgi:hypothetical protein